MKLTKNDFFAAIKRLGPHACLEFVLSKNEDIYNWLNEEIELDKLRGTHPVEFDLNDLHATVIAREMMNDNVYVEIVKKPEGFLGFY